MKTLPAAITTHLNTRTTTMATALKITRTDGTVFGFTNNSIDDVVSGVTYRSNPGLDVSNIETTANAAVGNLELTTLHDGTVFTTSDILGGVWKNAAFTIFRYNRYSIADGIDTLVAGTFGEVEILENVVKVELRDLRQYLQQAIGDVSSKNCRARLGDTRCTVRVQPSLWAATTSYTARTAGDAATGSVVRPSTDNARHFKCTTAGISGGSEPAWNTTVGGTTTDGTVTWTTIQALTVTGTLTGVTSKQVFQDTGRGEAVNYFDEGELTWTGGANNGLAAKVKSYAANGTFTLALPMYGTVAIGDTYSVVAGCRKRLADDCATKFDNVLNFVGEPHRQGINSIIQSPAADV